MEKNTRLFSVSTGRVTPFLRRSKKAAEYITTLNGYVGAHPTLDGDYMLWLFETAEQALEARKLMSKKGIECGNNICEFEWLDDDVIQFVGVAEGKDKGKGYVNS